MALGGCRIAAFDGDIGKFILLLLDSQLKGANAVGIAKILVVVNDKSVGEIVFPLYDASLNNLPRSLYGNSWNLLQEP